MCRAEPKYQSRNAFQIQYVRNENKRFSAKKNWMFNRDKGFDIFASPYVQNQLALMFCFNFPFWPASKRILVLSYSKRKSLIWLAVVFLFGSFRFGWYKRIVYMLCYQCWRHHWNVSIPPCSIVSWIVRSTCIKPSHRPQKYCQLKTIGTFFFFLSVDFFSVWLMPMPSYGLVWLLWNRVSWSHMCASIDYRMMTPSDINFINLVIWSVETD